MSNREDGMFAYLDIFDKAWFAFIETQAQVNIFHHPAWAGLLAECYGFKPFVLVKLDEFGKIRAGIPFMDVDSRLTGHRWVALPFSDHCVPIFQDRLSLDAIMEYLVYQYVQHAIPRVDIHFTIPVRDNVYENTPFVWHTIKLINDPDILFRTFDRSRVRQPIQQAVKRGVEVRWATAKSEMDIFYNLLVLTHRRLGVPVQPKHFFDLLWDELIEKKLGFLLLAYIGNEPIAGSVYLYYKKMLTVKYNASQPKYWQFKANNLLYWSAIKWGCDNEFTTFDLGRTVISNQGLRDFKNGWGTIEEPLIYSSIGIDDSGKNRNGLEKIANIIIRNTPPIVCRITGELFYKHYA